MEKILWAILILTLAVGLGGWLVRARRRRHQENAEYYKEDRERSRRKSTQKNITGRLCNELRKHAPALKFESFEFNGGYHINVARAGVEPPNDLVLGIFVNLINERNQGQIYVRYLPSMAAGWFGSDESQLLELIRTLHQYLGTQVPVAA